jgi:hypothetical protein
MHFHFSEAAKILFQTKPYLLLRLGIYSLIGLVSAIYLCVVLLISKIFGGGGAIVFIAGLILMAVLLRLLKQYVLYLVNAGHLAVITELLERGTLPEGVNQLEYGKTVVTNLFKEVSVLFVLDEMVKGILRAFNGTVTAVAEFFPIPGLDGLAKIVNSVLNFSLAFIVATIFSYNLARGDENVWNSAKRGLILYGQNWKPILKTAAASALVNFVGFIALFLILLIPFAPLAMMTHNQTLKFFWMALAFTLAFGLKLSLFNPFFQVSMILTFRSATAGQEPNAEWEGRLEMASEKFRELKEKAEGFVHDKMSRADSPVTAN